MSALPAFPALLNCSGRISNDLYLLRLVNSGKLLLMVDIHSLLGFALVSFGMVMTPGPNMLYLISRSICQGRFAGIFSLGGVVLGFLFYMVAASLGLTVLLFAVPFAYDALKFAGAAYLFWLAWNAIKPGSRSVFAVQDLPPHSTRRLFLMGLLTNLLNPKIAALYLSLLPQFVRPSAGPIVVQCVFLGAVQIAISFAVNLIIVLSASAVATFFQTKPVWLRIQKWFIGPRTRVFGISSSDRSCEEVDGSPPCFA
jgi:threonine/homoserine/homoserine lactone efflux protein